MHARGKKLLLEARGGEGLDFSIIKTQVGNRASS